MKCPRTSLFTLALGCLLVALGLTGCSTELDFHATTYDGQKVAFKMVNGVPERPLVDGVRSDNPKVDTDDKTKKVRYHAHLFDTTGLGFKSVRVEDVTEEKAYLIIEDNHPKLDLGHIWQGTSADYTLDDEASKYLTYLDESVRLYRFTFVRPDGRTFTMHDVLVMPAYAKAYVRKALGATY